MKHTIVGNKDRLKGQMEELLKKRFEAHPNPALDEGLTLGEIAKLLDLDKTRHNDVSATLIKLQGEGKVTFKTGHATSSKGRRFVKKYRFKKQAADKAKPAAVGDSDDRRFLSLCR